MFESLGNRLDGIFKDLRRRGKLNEADVDAAMREIRLALLEADVHYSVVKAFVARVRERAIGAEVSRSLTPGQQVVKIVHDELINTLGQGGRLALSGTTPHVIMLVGLQGAGKTTAAAKLALYLRREGYRPMLVAADVYRPAAVEQLKSLGRQLDIPVYDEGVTSPPPQIATNGVLAAARDNRNIAIIDTAGRLQIDESMMDEVATIRERTKPKGAARCGFDDRPGSGQHRPGLQREGRFNRPDPDQGRW
jgi:signal recognition particle subunit SRP54